MSQWETPACCFRSGASPRANATNLKSQLLSCIEFRHNHDDRYPCYHDGSFDYECYGMVRRVVRRLAEQYPDEADREASYLQSMLDSQIHDVRHWPPGETATEKHFSRIWTKRARRILKLLVQNGAKQPEVQRYYDWCHKCDQEKGR